MSENPLDDIKNSFANMLHPPVNVADLLANTVPYNESNQARWMHTRLGKYIKKFEDDLDADHEIGARLVSFGQAITFHIEDIGYYGPDIICFYGLNSEGEKVQLIQHLSQLSVLLIAMKKLGEAPRRIGFKWADEKEDNN